MDNNRNGDNGVRSTPVAQTIMGIVELLAQKDASKICDCCKPCAIDNLARECMARRTDKLGDAAEVIRVCEAVLSIAVKFRPAGGPIAPGILQFALAQKGREWVEQFVATLGLVVTEVPEEICGDCNFCKDLPRLCVTDSATAERLHNEPAEGKA